ncbi:MAG: ABC transporter permease, partial [Candidatus Asgardarchaeia archaeon]
MVRVLRDLGLEHARAKGRRSATSLHLLFILITLTLWSAYPVGSSDGGLITLSGRVIDFETRWPIENATVSVWEGHVLIAQGSTNALGIFHLRVPKGHSYRVYAYMDIPNTMGWDYLPAFREVFSPTGDVNLTMELRAGASVIIDNDIQFVDTTFTIHTYTYEVIDPETGGTLNIEGYEFIYGTLDGAHGHFLNLNASCLVVPADIPFSIRVNASAIIKERYVNRSFLIDEPGHFRLPKGGLIHLNVRKYSLQYNLEMMDGEVAKTKAKIDEMDKLGFYLALEKQRLVRIFAMMESVRLNLLRGDYINGFKELRKAYIELTDLYTSLTGAYRSAATSVYILIFFLAFTSTTISFLFFEKLRYKTAASGGLTVVTHLLIHEIYPGAAHISAGSFFTFSLLACCSSLLVTIVIPHFLKGRAVAGRTPLRNIIVPIFSLAKRSLTCRRLRFILTLSSVTILVMSFVTLTSFTMGYGLILRPISRQIVPVDGVLVRAPHGEYSEEPSTFTPLDAESVEWFIKQDEVEVVAPKAENLPTLIPLLTLNGRPIYGILGILPSAEAKIFGLDRFVEEGRYLLDGEENAILISDRLKEELGVEVNATLRLSGMNMVLVGVVS